MCVCCIGSVPTELGNVGQTIRPELVMNDNSLRGTSRGNFTVFVHLLVLIAFFDKKVQRTDDIERSSSTERLWMAWYEG